MNRDQRQALALAGVFQAAVVVDELARTGRYDTRAWETLIKATVDPRPDQFADIYGDDLANLGVGMNAARKLLDHPPAGSQVMRYMLSIQLLATRARKDPALMSQLGERLERIQQQAHHLGPTHDNVVLALGELYSDTLSTLRYRIVVKGDPELLKTPHMAERVRAVLLSGVRFSLLWRQQGGHRWQILLTRKRIKQTLDELRSSME
ncbi:high frequency lysogenization protein HflD [Carnimonas bestiolae]|uniref:high frequency lysogenization protein HflD n=1 Tax=Carnimonas bestiolae TaxID=3402172 RepID=UPI003EDC2088